MNRLDSTLSVPRSTELAALILRLGLGAVFLAHALAKPLVFTLSGTVQFFAASGFPGWTAYPVFLAELLGGVALLAGLRTRVVALALLPVMAGALLVHLPNGWMFSGQGGGWEYVAFLMMALGAQALLGDGAFAVGRLQRS
ncbi:DoxX family protein [Sorangium sp. So ce260]|uniref:DoxX family protein n=1 Tax=Sorangium sp. So ce260 TaxID=3133291 RepID=UPI003F5FF963